MLYWLIGIIAGAAVLAFAFVWWLVHPPRKPFDPKACPRCGSLDLDLNEETRDGTTRVQAWHCGTCGHYHYKTL